MKYVYGTKTKKQSILYFINNHKNKILSILFIMLNFWSFIFLNNECFKRKSKNFKLIWKIDKYKKKKKYIYIYI